MRGIKWLSAVAIGVAGLLGEPGALRAEPPPRSFKEARALHFQIEALLKKDQYAEAIPLMERQLTWGEQVMRRSHLDPDHPPGRLSKEAEAQLRDYAELLYNLGRALIARGDYDLPERPLTRALAMRERLGEDHAYIIQGLTYVGRLYAKRGEYARAEPPLARAVAIGKEKDSLGHNPDTDLAFSELGILLLAKGELARAEPLLKAAVEGTESGEDGARRRDNLAALYLAKGDPLRAEPLLQGALKLTRADTATLRPDHAFALDGLARLYVETAAPARAEALFLEAIAVRERLFGPEHPDIAGSLDGLAAAYLKGATPARAEPLLSRALAIRDKKLGPEHPDRADTLHLSGELRRLTGDLKGAEGVYQQALSLREKVLGAGHPKCAETLVSLAELRRASGDLPASESFYQRAIAVREKALGPDHPAIADAADRLAELYLSEGKAGPAVDALERASAMRDRLAAAIFSSATEQQKAATMASLRRETDLILSAHADAAPSDPRALTLALTAVLRRKGRVLDALADSHAAMRDRDTPDNATLLKQLVSIQGRIVELIVRGPGDVPADEHRAAIAELERQKQALEAEVSRRSAKLHVDDPMITPAKVQAVMPDGAALVEIAVRAPRANAGQREAPPRYAAYVLPKSGAARYADLGVVSELDGLARKLREALADPTRDPRPLARALDQNVMQPVRALLGGTRFLLMSPDGALNLIPFGALVDEDGRYLVERASFTYLTSGRDLLRYTYDETPKAPGLPALVVGAPEFGDPWKKHSRFRPESDAPAPTRSIDMSGIRFPPLPGTAAEAAAIGAAIPGAKVLSGADATEEAIKAAAHPRILHLATHGFFLPDQRADPEKSLSADTLENPLLRAGVALALANQPAPGKEDGILTALEATGLDLYGTRLVVLSACETGVGEAVNGDGVYGLRRALMIAGAQTLVMSLWKISDEETRDLMVAYYQRLEKGGGRSEALREVALAMRGDGQHAHPYYWASFIVSGDGSTLRGQDVPPQSYGPPRVPPGARSCGCALVGAGAPRSFGHVLGLGALLFGYRRRARPRPASRNR